jgi:hypothetical protein
VATIGGQAPVTSATTAGGALSGTFPSPALDVSGGPCANGEALLDVSAQAVLTCGPGVYTDTDDNTAAGRSSLQGNTGTGNAAFGASSLSGSNTGSSNAAFGASTMLLNESGSQNSAVGQSALLFNRTGGNNTAVGYFTLRSNQNSNSTAVGANALQSNFEGESNSAFGSQAMLFNSSGSDNTTLGYQALSNSISGSRNIAVGRDAGAGYSAGESDNIVIGSPGTTGESHAIRIGGENGTGSGQHDTLFIPAATSTVGSGTPLQISASGQIGAQTSSRRFKTGIRPLGSQVDRLMALEPVSFHYKRRYVRGQPNPLQFGLIAEDVARVYPNLVVDGRDGRPHAVAYQELPVLLLAQLQRQQRQIGKLRAAVAALRRRAR